MQLISRLEEAYKAAGTCTPVSRPHLLVDALVLSHAGSLLSLFSRLSIGFTVGFT